MKFDVKKRPKTALALSMLMGLAWALLSGYFGHLSLEAIDLLKAHL